MLSFLRAAVDTAVVTAVVMVSLPSNRTLTRKPFLRSFCQTFLSLKIDKKPVQRPICQSYKRLIHPHIYIDLAFKLHLS